MSQFDSSKDYYSILGAEEEASLSEIERLYKRLAKDRHPDRGGDEEGMKELNEAYGVLRDETARSAYDRERRSKDGREDFQPASSPSAQADAISGQMVGSLLCLGVGLFLLLLVRFQWVWFIWPLAILAVFVIIMGVLMAHAVMLNMRETFSLSHPLRRYTFAQELAFWAVVCAGGYGLYLVLSVV